MYLCTCVYVCACVCACVLVCKIVLPSISWLLKHLSLVLFQVITDLLEPSKGDLDIHESLSVSTAYVCVCNTSMLMRSFLKFISSIS